MEREKSFVSFFNQLFRIQNQETGKSNDYAFIKEIPQQCDFAPINYLEPLRYKDIGELMRRCETLVATRGDLTLMRDKIKQTIGQEEESLAQFKEEQNEKILELR